MFKTLAIAAGVAISLSSAAMADRYCGPGYVYYHYACHWSGGPGYVVSGAVGTAGYVAGTAVGTAGYVAGTAVNTAGYVAGSAVNAATGIATGIIYGVTGR
jgi:hypothetical protein